MKRVRPVWLASYPRSGNTFLRTILWHCFGMVSASVYPNDLGGNRELEHYVGHIEHAGAGRVEFPSGAVPLIKTHDYPRDGNPAIYVVRDGIAASVSLFRFYGERMPMRDVIGGKHRFGTWSAHLNAWKPWERTDTLLLRYEQLRDNLPAALESIGAFLERDMVSQIVPERDRIAKVDGRWVRTASDEAKLISLELRELFIEVNGSMMRQMGYGVE